MCLNLILKSVERARDLHYKLKLGVWSTNAKQDSDMTYILLCVIVVANIVWLHAQQHRKRELIQIKKLVCKKNLGGD